MWKRASSKLLSLRSAATPTRLITPTFSPLTLRPSATTFIICNYSGNVSKKVEDVMPIATGHEREELEAELQGRDILDINFPEGPFGTKEAPAVVKSYYDQRIVGCPGAEGEDEHDVVWFWLKKGEPHECPVCSQYFVLEVVGPGGLPDGLDEDEHHHHH
ncbi:cytochrome c oxidase subunit 5b-1, mitochondrial-like [Bidens hawaiensis]|uniref:cytochrome c oxidase subunit 5b-1, mitochondrial-like n=1 Tax=Bidens hawaiensis TaxID=980011 RepID=UPI00404B3036